MTTFIRQAVRRETSQFEHSLHFDVWCCFFLHFFFSLHFVANKERYWITRNKAWSESSNSTKAPALSRRLRLHSWKERGGAPCRIKIHRRKTDLRQFCVTLMEVEKWSHHSPSDYKSTPKIKYRVGQKTGLFLRWDYFATTNDRKACIGYVKSFRILSRMRRIICMSVQLNILCIIFINRQYPQNCIEFDNDAWVLLNFHSKYSKTRIYAN